MRIPKRTHLEASIVGEGPPVLLVHGLGGSWGVWQEVVRLLRGDPAVLTLDLPGSGRSAPPLARDGCADFEALADREPLAGLPILACVRDAPWADTPE